MKLLIISGLSGSGKSIVLHVLEDLGYYCIDNLPAGMLPSLADQLQQHHDNKHEYFAVGIDARNLTGDLEQLPNILNDLKNREIHCEVFFLEADDSTLLKRFSETRRRHPLSNRHLSLSEAIDFERELLEPIAERADLFIDTSNSTVHQLRDMVYQRIGYLRNTRLSLLFESFGYKSGVPTDADFVFDARCLPNPHWQPGLRPLTGRDKEVIAYLDGEPEVARMCSELCSFLDNWIPAFEADKRNYLTVAIGCTGGQHRSVYLVEHLQRYFKERYPDVAKRHRELP